MTLSSLVWHMPNTPASFPSAAVPGVAGVDALLLRKLSYGADLLAAGELAAAGAMLTHVIDVADATGAEDRALYTLAFRLIEHITTRP
jgi:hypothetical protein